MTNATNKVRFTSTQKAIGLVVASFVGWFLTTIMALGWPYVEISVANSYFGHEALLPFWRETAALMVLYAIFGLPTALIACLVIGWPLWILGEKRGMRSFADAAKLGAQAGFIIGAAGIVFRFLLGLPTALDDSSSYDEYWRDGYQVIRDGLPTLLGLAFQLLGMLWTVLVGAVSGFTARLAVGVPR